MKDLVLVEAKQPADWDEEEDGEWEAPKIKNPKCETAPGCGEWKRPLKPNPAYKGKWTAPLIDNPAYKVRDINRMLWHTASFVLMVVFFIPCCRGCGRLLRCRILINGHGAA